MIAKQRLYRSADGEVVDEADPRAAFLLATEGKEVPKEYVAKVKAFLGDEPAEPASPDAEEAAEKQAAKPADKAVRKQTNKAK